MTAAPHRPIGEVLKAHQAEWMAVPGVVMVGIGESAGKPSIRIIVSDQKALKALPDSADGYPVLKDVRGEVRALDR